MSRVLPQLSWVLSVSASCEKLQSRCVAHSCSLSSGCDWGRICFQNHIFLSIILFLTDSCTKDPGLLPPADQRSPSFCSQLLVSVIWCSLMVCALSKPARESLLARLMVQSYATQSYSTGQKQVTGPTNHQGMELHKDLIIQRQG